MNDLDATVDRCGAKQPTTEQHRVPQTKAVSESDRDFHNPPPPIPPDAAPRGLPHVRAGLHAARAEAAPGRPRAGAGRCSPLPLVQQCVLLGGGAAAAHRACPRRARPQRTACCAALPTNGARAAPRRRRCIHDQQPSLSSSRFWRATCSGTFTRPCGGDCRRTARTRSRHRHHGLCAGHSTAKRAPRPPFRCCACRAS